MIEGFAEIAKKHMNGVLGVPCDLCGSMLLFLIASILREPCIVFAYNL